MRRTTAFALTLTALLITQQHAFAVAGWSTDATPGHTFSEELAHDYGWPAGTLAVVNHASRHYGWHFWFSECPNDQRSFGYTLKNTAQANDLLAIFAAVRHERKAVILGAAPGPAVEVKKDVICDARLTLGSQSLLDRWYAALPTKTIGGVTVRVWGVHTYTARPTAHAPVLHLHIDGDRLRLADLKIPAHLRVSAFPPPKDADEKLRAACAELSRFVEEHEAERKRLEEQKESAK